MKRPFTEALLQASLLGATLMILVAADRLLGIINPGYVLSSVMHPPHTQVTVKTPEFTYIATTNGMGLRDREYVEDAAPIRILAFGDSFTYGWGVALEDTWVKRLEKALRESGFDLEIINLGKTGAGPPEIASIAEVAIPLLNPEIVIVALQQTDDIQQSVHDPAFDGLLRNLYKPSRWSGLNYRLRQLFPNFSLLFSAGKIENLNWAKTVETILSAAEPDDLTRFGQLDSEVARRFLAGELNPGLMVLILRAPEYYTQLGPSNPKSTTGEKIRAASAALTRIRAAAETAGATTLGISIPNRTYIHEKYAANTARLGFQVDPAAIGAGWPDNNTGRALAGANIPMISVTREFRRACENARCFFEYDDHINLIGHSALATLLQFPVAAAVTAVAENAN